MARLFFLLITFASTMIAAAADSVTIPEIEGPRAAYHQALAKIRGIATSVPFHQKIIRDPDFRAGRFTTYFMEEKIASFQYPDPVEPLDRFLVSSTALFAHFLAGGLPGSLAHRGGVHRD